VETQQLAGPNSHPDPEKANLAAAIEQAAEAIVITSAQGIIQYANPAFTTITGYTAAEVIGQAPNILKSGLQSGEFYRQMWETISAGQVWHGGLINRRKDGSNYTEDMSITPVRDASGVIASYIAIKQDSTARRAGENASRFLAAMVNASDDAIFAHSPEGIILTWNRGAANLSGYSSAEAIGRHVSMLSPHDSHAQLTAIMQRVAQGEVISQFEAVGVRKDGTLLDTSITSCPITDSSGEIFAVSVVLRDISEQKQSEKAKSHLAAIIESSQDAIISQDLHRNFTSWNKGAEVLFGYTAAEVIGTKGTVAIPPGFVDGVAETIDAVRTGKPGGVVETVRLHKNGTPIDVSLSFSPIWNLCRQVVGASVVARDIRARKHAEDALRESEERFRIMADTSPTLIWVTGPRGNVQFVNRQFREFFGFSADETEFRVERLVHPDDAAAYIRSVRRALRSRTAQVGEIRLRRADGQYRWVLSHAEPRFDKAGRFLGHVGISTDITERVQAEADVRNSEEMFRQFASNVHEVFWVMNTSPAEVAYINPAYEKVWGRSCESLRENPNSWIDALIPEDRPVGIARFEKQLQGICQASEYRIQTPAGIRWISDHSFPIVDHAGKVIRIAGIAEDITERKQREEDLVRARNAADAANLAKSSFLANMSHEIRTPMNGVLGMLQLLSESGLSPEQQRYAEVAQTSAHTLLALIDDILDLSKIEAGRITLEKLDFSLSDVLDACLEALRTRAVAKGLAFSAATAPEIPDMLRGDPLRLRQILVNLIANSIKFTDCGSVSLEVALEGRAAGGVCLRFSVTDTGIGIPPDRVPQLFSPFVQADVSTTRKYGGSGLGLAISRQLAEMMGGAIGVESQPGHGSTFWFTVALETSCAWPPPITMCQVEVSPRPSPAPKAPDALSAPVPHTHSARILVADDNPTNLMVIMAQLAKLGYGADSVVNGGEALAALDRETYSLVLMDCQMPVMDGYEATRRIRASRHREMPVIAVTAHAMAGDREKCLNAGMSDYLAKPVELHRLAEILSRWTVTPASQGLRSSIEIFDERALLERLMNDRQLATKVMQGFLSDFPRQLDQLGRKIAESDALGAGLQAHAMKGAAATVAAGGLRAVALEIEQAGRAGALPRVIELIPVAAREFHHLQTALRHSGWA